MLRMSVFVSAYRIVGFPGKTDAEFQETVSFILEHKTRLSFFSLTPFQLARNSPMANDPSQYGLKVLSDPIPRQERLRFNPESKSGWDAPIEGTRRFQEGIHQFLPWIETITGPEPTHDWMHASVVRGMVNQRQLRYQWSHSESTI